MIHSPLYSLAVIAWRNLRRNMRRNFATGVAITAGFTAFILASGYANRVENVLSAYTVYGLRAGHVTVMKKDALEKFPIKPKEWSLTLREQESIRNAGSKITGLEMIGRVLEAQGIAGNGCKTFPFLASGVDYEAEKFSTDHPSLHFWAPHISKSRRGDPIWNFSPEDVVLSVSSGLGRLLGKTKTRSELPSNASLTLVDCNDSEVKDRFSDDASIQLASGTWDGQLNAIDGDMTHVFSTGLQETNNASITLGIHHLQTLLNTDHVTRMVFWIGNRQNTNLAITELKRELQKDTAIDLATLEILPWNNERIGPYYSGTMRFIFTMVYFIGFVLAIVIVLSIFNSATMTVIERSEEIGMMRSIGYSQGLIRVIFALEGLYLTLISTVTGTLVGVLAINIVNRLNITFNPPGVEGGLILRIALSTETIILATICVSSLGLFATWFAVYGVSKKNIAELVAGSHR